MISENTKIIFNNAAKKNEAFVREAISVFPKVDTDERAFAIELSSGSSKKLIRFWPDCSGIVYLYIQLLSSVINNIFASLLFIS